MTADRGEGQQISLADLVAAREEAQRRAEFVPRVQIPHSLKRGLARIALVTISTISGAIVVPDDVGLGLGTQAAEASELSLNMGQNALDDRYDFKWVIGVGLAGLGAGLYWGSKRGKVKKESYSSEEYFNVYRFEEAKRLWDEFEKRNSGWRENMGTSGQQWDEYLECGGEYIASQFLVDPQDAVRIIKEQPNPIRQQALYAATEAKLGNENHVRIFNQLVTGNIAHKPTAETPSTNETDKRESISKDPEWTLGRNEATRRWQAAKVNLPPVASGDTGNEPGYVLDRFKAGFGVVHETILDDSQIVPDLSTRVRSGIEYLIPEIWPDEKIFKRFFDPTFNQRLTDSGEFIKIILLPESFRRNPSLTRAQKVEVKKISRVMLHALHPDLPKVDADPNLKGQIEMLLRVMNTNKDVIDGLVN